MAVADRKSIQYDLYCMLTDIEWSCADLKSRYPYRYMLGTGPGNVLLTLHDVCHTAAEALNRRWKLNQ